MSSVRATRARLSRYLVEVRGERAALASLAEEIRSYRPALEAAEPDRPILALFASDLHDYYTALETLFERTARVFDGEVPAGAESHRELIDQMAAALPPFRPALLDDGLRVWLHDLRRLRHFVRHAYAVRLSAAELRRHADLLAHHHEGLYCALEAFFALARQTLDALPE